MKHCSLLCFVWVFSCPSVFAQSDYYYGLNVASISYDRDALPAGTDMFSLYGRMGAYLGQNLSFEGRIGFGMTRGSVAVGARDKQIKNDNFIGVLLKAEMPLSDRLRPYGLLGLTHLEFLEYGDKFIPKNYARSDLSYGFGVDFFYQEYAAFNVEYVRFFDKDGLASSGLMVGLVGYFY